MSDYIDLFQSIGIICLWIVVLLNMYGKNGS